MKLRDLIDIQLPNNAGELDITGISDDSRNISHGNLFVAVKGNNIDGNVYIDSAIRNGASCVVFQSENNEYSVAYSGDVIMIAVPDVRETLACIASKFYPSQFEGIIAVTGTNGKSSTVDIVRQVLRNCSRPAASIGTLGVISHDKLEELPNHLTCPGALCLHSILHKLHGHGIKYVALEASSHGIEQKRLDGLHFKVCAFTNLTQDHLDYHGTVEKYWEAKSKLFSHLADDDTWIIVNADNEYADKIYALAKNKNKCISYGYNEASDIRILDVAVHGSCQHMQLQFFSERLDIVLPLQGSFQVYNSLCAAAICYCCCLSIADIKQGLEKLRPVSGRMELVGTYRNADIYVDYAHTPDALQNAIVSLKAHTQNRVVVVFGCGGNRDAQKRHQMGQVATECADIVIVTDDNPRHEDPALIRKMILEGCHNATEVPNRRDAINYAIDLLQDGDSLLIAGRGSTDYQLIGDQTIYFSDADVVRARIES